MQSTQRRIITVQTHIFDGKHIPQDTCTLSFLDIPPVDICITFKS